LVDELRLIDAVHAEMDWWQNLRPPESWRPQVKASAGELARWIEARLLSGSRNAENAIVSAKKIGHGTRPAPVMGIAERVVYRALAKHVLEPIGFPDRSSQAYARFVLEPLQQGWQTGPGFRTVANAQFTHVVETDVTAFYEYVDHELLKQELVLQTGKVGALDHLMELLSECQGRTFGLPQTYEPSDWLSDYYIGMVERDVARRGFSVWRFNDDFRIGCRSYSEAIQAIETLSDSARSVGLTLSANKTFTPTFINYLVKNSGLEIAGPQVHVDPQDVEAIVGIYPGSDEEESLDRARAVLARLRLPENEASRIDITRVNSRELAELRRAYGTFGRNERLDGLEWVKPLFEFIPALTPQLMTYLTRIVNQALDLVTELMLSLRSRDALGEWQAGWLAYGYRELGVEIDAGLITWARSQRERSRTGFFAAEVALLLADLQEVDFGSLDEAIRTEPEVFVPWYLSAVRSLTHGPAPPSSQERSALQSTSPLAKCILSGVMR
jgi:hypothetical protein